MCHTPLWRTLVLLSLLTLSSATTLVQLNSGLKTAAVSFARRNSSAIRALNGDAVGGTVGLGDVSDLTYLVAATVGNSTVSLNIDTGSTDLWVVSSACQTQTCQSFAGERYALTQAFQQSQQGSVDLLFGDSTTGTHAAGPLGRDVVVLAGLTATNQTFAAINDTDNSAVANGGAGILGLGFPSQSFIGESIVSSVFKDIRGSDTFVEQWANYGPIIPRLILAGVLDQPLFTITLQRDELDVSGTGQLTIGQLPSGIDNSSLTWVPVRLYLESEGGMTPPSFASNEVYPLRWEIPLDGVFLDGVKLADSAQNASGISKPSLSALIDTGNSLIRGPADVVSAILANVSSTFAANASNAPLLPCAPGHNLTFQIGGKIFPVDPRDFVSQNSPGDAATCVASAVVGTDPPSSGALFSWSLGDPFLKSNLVAFYYGNLTNPSADPPRIGILSLVPSDAEEELEQAVGEAQENGGVFETTSQAAPTDSRVIVGTASKTHTPGLNGLPGSLSTATPDEENAAFSVRGLAVGAVGRACVLVVLSSLSLSLDVL
ncbi:acid protease [Dichomitus squalens]|uniref:Acid protease n=1 Tax=Dichomitus squalens TaxID=114155 RepID=A0A4Q9NHJ8_9APHY|nr:acid protease [Dichomitus squalens]TBU52050.1 acid protease [Dichomitus squalens]